MRTAVFLSLWAATAGCTAPSGEERPATALADDLTDRARFTASDHEAAVLTAWLDAAGFGPWTAAARLRAGAFVVHTAERSDGARRVRMFQHEDGAGAGAFIVARVPDGLFVGNAGGGAVLAGGAARAVEGGAVAGALGLALPAEMAPVGALDRVCLAAAVPACLAGALRDLETCVAALADGPDAACAGPVLEAWTACRRPDVCDDGDPCDGREVCVAGLRPAEDLAVCIALPPRGGDPPGRCVRVEGGGVEDPALALLVAGEGLAPAATSLAVRGAAMDARFTPLTDGRLAVDLRGPAPAGVRVGLVVGGDGAGGLVAFDGRGGVRLRSDGGAEALASLATVSQALEEACAPAPRVGEACDDPPLDWACLVDRLNETTTAWTLGGGPLVGELLRGRADCGAVVAEVVGVLVGAGDVRAAANSVSLVIGLLELTWNALAVVLDRATADPTDWMTVVELVAEHLEGRADRRLLALVERAGFVEGVVSCALDLWKDHVTQCLERPDEWCDDGEAANGNEYCAHVPARCNFAPWECARLAQPTCAVRCEHFSSEGECLHGAFEAPDRDGDDLADACDPCPDLADPDPRCAHLGCVPRGIVCDCAIDPFACVPGSARCSSEIDGFADRCHDPLADAEWADAWRLRLFPDGCFRFGLHERCPERTFCEDCDGPCRAGDDPCRSACDDCVPGAVECLDDRRFRRCVEHATFPGCSVWREEACAERCVGPGDGDPCLRHECEAGARRCGADGTAVEACVDTEAGRRWSPADACDPGEACEDGRCVQGCRSCTPGETRCAAGTPSRGVEACECADADPCSCAWVAREDCADLSVCVDGECRMVEGACRDDGCAPGERGCDGARVLECVISGCDVGWTEVEACAERCEGGACVAGPPPPACDPCDAPGARQCRGGDAHVCAAIDGRSCWRLLLACGGRECRDGDCVNGGACHPDGYVFPFPGQCNPQMAAECCSEACQQMGRQVMCAGGQCVEQSTQTVCAGDADCCQPSGCAGCNMRCDQAAGLCRYGAGHPCLGDADCFSGRCARAGLDSVCE